LTVGRPKQFGAARTAVLAAADRLFYERGIAAVSLDAVAKEAGVTRRTLYYHFTSKDRLVAAYLTRRAASSHAFVEQAAQGSASHVRAILAVFSALERWFCTREFRGCALTNAVGERGETIVVAGPITRRHKLAICDWFVTTSRAAGAGDPVALGEMLMLLFDGALTSATTRRSPESAVRARSAAELLMIAHGLDAA